MADVDDLANSLSRARLSSPPTSPNAPPLEQQQQQQQDTADASGKAKPVDIPEPSSAIGQPLLAMSTPQSSSSSDSSLSVVSDDALEQLSANGGMDGSNNGPHRNSGGHNKTVHSGSGRHSKSFYEAIKSFRAGEPRLVETRSFAKGRPEPKRLLFIGDIHGCLKEFDRLLKKAGYKPDEDQIILVGDLVAKGPDSIGVIRRARELDAWCVRGNHDDRVIRWREFLEGPGKGLSHNELRALEKSRGLPYADFKLGKPHYQIARKLSPADFAFVSSFPAIMVLPPPYNDWLVVHGGLDPSKPLSRQDAHDVMNMRNIDSTGPISSRDKGLAWFELWSAKMKILSHHQSDSRSEHTDSTLNGADGNVTGSGEEADRASEAGDIDHVHFSRVVYGHDAGRDLQMHSFTKGLDTRCVYGGKLTAFILPGERLVSINCPTYEAAAVKDNRNNNGNSHHQAQRRRASNDNSGQQQQQQQQQGQASNTGIRGRRNYRRRNNNSTPKYGTEASSSQKPVSHSYSGVIGRYLQLRPQQKQQHQQEQERSQHEAVDDEGGEAPSAETKSRAADGRQPNRRSRNRKRANSAF